MVFESQNNSAVVTLYCKTPKNTESSEMKSIKLVFKDKSFDKALKKSGNGEYNIYYNSICAYYPADNLSDDSLHSISVLLLDNAKYKTDNFVFIKNNISAEKLHKYAKSTCDSESVKRTDTDLYLRTLKALRQYN